MLRHQPSKTRVHHHVEGRVENTHFAALRLTLTEDHGDESQTRTQGKQAKVYFKLVRLMEDIGYLS